MPEIAPPTADAVVTGPVRHPTHAVEAGLRTGFGVAAIVIEVTRQVLAGGATGTRALEAVPATQPNLPGDALMGATWAVARAGGRALELTGRVISPAVGVALNPPLVPRILRPATHLDTFARSCSVS